MQEFSALSCWRLVWQNFTASTSPLTCFTKIKPVWCRHASQDESSMTRAVSLFYIFNIFLRFILTKDRFNQVSQTSQLRKQLKTNPASNPSCEEQPGSTSHEHKYQAVSVSEKSFKNNNEYSWQQWFMTLRRWHRVWSVAVWLQHVQNDVWCSKCDAQQTELEVVKINISQLTWVMSTEKVLQLQQNSSHSFVFTAITFYPFSLVKALVTEDEQTVATSCD